MSKIQELICTKINHDLIGNVGAVCNAVELLEEGDMDFIEDIKAILKTSSFVLASRCKLFRVAFGSNNAVVDNLEVIMQDYVKTISSKNYPILVKLESFDKNDAKLLCLLVMIVADLMIKGGKIVICGNKVKISSLQTNEEKLNGLKNFSLLELVPANAPCLYLQEVLVESAKKLAVSKQDEQNILIEVML